MNLWPEEMGWGGGGDQIEAVPVCVRQNFVIITECTIVNIIPQGEKYCIPEFFFCVHHCANAEQVLHTQSQTDGVATEAQLHNTKLYTVSK